MNQNLLAAGVVVAAVLSFARVAHAQGAPEEATTPEAPSQTPAGAQPAPASTAAPPAPGPAAGARPSASYVPASEPGQQGGAAGTLGSPEQMLGTRQSRLLVPRYGEDYYPAMPKEDGILRGIPLEEKTGLRFAMHGYFRAPMLITKAARDAGSTKPNEGAYNWRQPYLVDDDYFRSGFAYTRINEHDWSELYLSVGNDHLTATAQLQGTLYSDAARPIIDRQLGVAQGWLTYRSDLKFIPWFDHVNLRVKGGAFWERFGHLPMYDTYIFARIHQMGENVRFELEKDKTTIWLEHGVGTHLDDIASNEGLTFINYATAGVGYDRTIEIGGYWFDSSARDKRPLKDLTDSYLSIVGTDVRADAHYLGRFYGATSYVKADQATWQSPAIEVMHSYGGRGLTENYFGTQSSDNGTGSLWNVAFQYDFSLADTNKAWTGRTSPLPWNGDLTATLFGVYTYVQSKQSSPDPLINKDDRKMFKWGAEGGWRITEWVGLSTRYDRVILDAGDSANSFRVVSPRLAFFTSFITREMLFIQYSRYMYNERIRLRPGQEQLESIPDDHAVKIQAQMTW